MEKIQLVDSEGEFQQKDAIQFSEKNHLDKSGLNYIIIAIMGPQSSGKSTLLNQMFGTQFQVMDVTSMISQTTKGIWLSRSNKDEQDLVMVLDLEGSDSLERGEDDTSFEKRSALFALSSADIVLINMGFKEVGRLQQQLFLSTILQSNIKLQSQKLTQYDDHSNIRKPILLFSIRDVDSKVNIDMVKGKLREDLNRLWKSIKKPSNIEKYDITEFFYIEVQAFAHYNYHQDTFLDQVQDLRKKIGTLNSSYVKKQPFRVPGQDFVNVAESDWTLIQRDRDLDLPAQRKLQAEHKCRGIMEACINNLGQDQEWLGLMSKSEQQIIPNFREAAVNFIQIQSQSFQEQSQYYDDGVAKEYFVKFQNQLQDKLQPVINKQVNFLVESELQKFKSSMEELVQKTPNNFSKGTVDLQQKSAKSLTQESYKLSFNEQEEQRILKSCLQQFDTQSCEITKQIKLEYVFLTQKDICNEAKKRLQRAINRLQGSMPPNFWDDVNALYVKEVAGVVRSLKQKLGGFEMNEEEMEKGGLEVEKDLAQIIESSLKQLSLITESKARERFTQVFQTNNGLRREWGPKDNIEAIAQKAVKEAIKVVGVFSASQLRRYESGAQVLKQELPSYENIDIKRVQNQVTQYGCKIFGIDSQTGAASTSQLPILDAIPQKMIGLQANATTAATTQAQGQGQGQGSPVKNGKLAQGEQRGGKENGGVDVQEDEEHFHDELFGLDGWDHFDQERVYLQPSDVRVVIQRLQDAYNWDIKEARQKQDLKKGAKMPLWGWAMMAVLGYQEALYLVKSPLLLSGIAFGLYFLFRLYQRLDVDKQLERGLPGVINMGQQLLPASQDIFYDMFQQAIQSIQQLASNANERYMVDPNSRREVELTNKSRAGGSDTTSNPQQDVRHQQQQMSYN